MARPGGRTMPASGHSKEARVAGAGREEVRREEVRGQVMRQDFTQKEVGALEDCGPRRDRT